MAKYEKINKFIRVVLVLALIVGFLYYKNNFFDEIDGLQSQISGLQSDIESDRIMFRSLENQIIAGQIVSAGLWMDSLDNESYHKIINWELEHEDFSFCDKGDTDIYPTILISKNHYRLGDSPAYFLVYMFEKGDLIYERDGDVYCYLYPIDNMTPPESDCNLLCIENEG